MILLMIHQLLLTLNLSTGFPISGYVKSWGKDLTGPKGKSRMENGQRDCSTFVILTDKSGFLLKV